MSTRSNIIVVTPDHQAHQFYYHCDGYLSGVGEELRCFINESESYEDLLKKLATSDEYGDFYRDEGKFDQKLMANGLHADIEFLYVIKNKKLYYMEIWKSKDFEDLRTYKELVDYICISKHEIDLTKEVTDKGYIYEDNTPEDYTTTKTEVKTMNYTEEKARIENEIKELTAKLENLKKQENKEKKIDFLVEKFREFLENSDLQDVNFVKVVTQTNNDDAYDCEVIGCYFENIEPAKVETKPENETKNTEKPIEQPKTEETNETPENKPVKMKMTLDEFIDSLPEPAQK